MSNVIIFSLMMDWSDSEQGATDYTMQDSLGVLGTIIINAFIGVMLASIFGTVRRARSCCGQSRVTAASGVPLAPFPARPFSDKCRR